METEVPSAAAAEPGAGEHCPYSIPETGLLTLALKDLRCPDSAGSADSLV